VSVKFRNHAGPSALLVKNQEKTRQFPTMDDLGISTFPSISVVYGPRFINLVVVVVETNLMLVTNDT